MARDKLMQSEKNYRFLVQNNASPDFINEIKKLKNEINKTAASKKAYESIWRIKRKNGEILYIESRSNQINYKGRNARLVLGQDITKRVATEIELKISNERYRLATKASFDAIWDANL